VGFIIDSMRDFFKEEGWPVSKIGDYPALSMTYGGKEDAWPCIAQAVEDEGLFLFYSSCPLNAPENKRAAVGLFLSYANYNSYVGGFELNHEDGDIRFRTELLIKGLDEKSLSQGKVFQNLIGNIVHANLQNMELYLPAIKAVLNGQDPLEAIQDFL
jgi:hypothetical protein